MPLRLYCTNCGRQLLLDRAFSGGYCRCKFCGASIAVPNVKRSARKRPTTRPDKPPSSSERA
jgi:hypothetical protein